ncbi:MAG: 2-amino-4-hydroxy-6-hydroxymethyldihydropteridine diphosphokinase [Caldimonas sp.]
MSGTPAAGDGHDAYVGLGSNLGDRAAAIDRAFTELAALPDTALIARSSIYESAPLDAPGGAYLNAVAHVRTALAPLELLAALQAIESRHGRVRSSRNAPRPLDLDLLLHGATAMRTPALTLPHPRLHERAFVLLPMTELSPSLTIPGHGPLQKLRARVAGQAVAKLER